MPSVYQWSEIEMLLFILAFLRITALITSFPIFGVQSVPNSTKVLLSLILATVMFPSVKTINSGFLHDLNSGFLWLAAREVMIGLILGSIARFYFMAINIAGQITSNAMGLSAAQMFNPLMGTQSNILEQFQVTLAMLLFLGFNGHHLLLMAMHESFRLIPMSFDMIKWEGVKTVAAMGSDILVLGLKISAPVLVAMFLTQVAMGVIGRVVPQINVLVTSLHLSIIIGLFVIFVTLPFFLEGVHEMEKEMGENLFRIMKEM
ncbi:MAG: flagellar biosynthetic protein FliR [Pseudomonadota bacterium]